MSQNESVQLFQPSAEFVKQATISGVGAYQALCEEASKDYTGYWARLAREHVTWKQPFAQILDESNAPFYKWFADGKLNASYNCLDRNIEAGLGDKVAIVSETDDGEVRQVTYKELLVKVNQLANGLRAQGIKKGDRVIIYMAMGIEGVVAMQACARIGAIHSVVFGGFSAQSVRDRINDAGAVAVITTDEQCRGGKKLPLKPAVDEGIALGAVQRLVQHAACAGALAQGLEPALQVGPGGAFLGQAPPAVDLAAHGNVGHGEVLACHEGLVRQVRVQQRQQRFGGRH